MAAKRKGLSKTEKLRKNIKATIRRREAQGWEFSPIDLATVESGNYQQLKSLQRNNYRKLYENATVINPETGQVMTGRQYQLRGRWKGDMWEDIDTYAPDYEPEEHMWEDIDTYAPDYEPEEPEEYYEEPSVSFETIVYDNITSLYGLRGVKGELLQEIVNMIDSLIADQGNIIYQRMEVNGGRIMRLVQLYCMYYDPLSGSRNYDIGNPAFLQEIRQLLDPNVSLDELADYEGGEDYSDQADLAYYDMMEEFNG